jgi:hypothetical protein
MRFISTYHHELKRAHRKCASHCASQHSALRDDAWWDAGFVALTPLPVHENQQQPAETAEEPDDGRRTPGISGAAPLDGEQDHDDGRHEEGEAWHVEVRELVTEGELFGFTCWGCEEEDESEDGDGAAGKIDVKACLRMLAWNAPMER